MRHIKYDVGETISVSGAIKEIHINRNGVSFSVEMDTRYSDGRITVSEKDINNTVESHKAEISCLREQLKASDTDRQNLYKSLLEAKSEPCECVKGDSHHPSKNTYSDEWRELP